MAHSSHALHGLAARLLAHASAQGLDGADPVRTLRDIGVALSAELGSLVGRSGAEALLERALDLARRQWPPIAANGIPQRWNGLAESSARLSPQEAGALAETVVANLLGLLVDLLGEDLGLSPVRRVWPGVIPGDLRDLDREGSA